jgi:gas vesicle protein
MKTKSIVLGLAAAAAAGAALGVLFAPKKGAVTRRMFKKKTSDYADSLKDEFNNFVDIIDEKLAEVKEDYEKAKSRAAMLKKDVRSAAG